MKTVTYMKEHIVSFPVQNLVFHRIPVYKSVRLSLFEKYIILLLRNGVQADSKEHLIEILSSLLNYSSISVSEFIDRLFKEGSIRIDKKKYRLKDEVHFIIEPISKEMFVDLEAKPADCDKIVFVEGLIDFFLKNDFSTDIFKRRNYSSLCVFHKPSDKLLTALQNNREKIVPLMKRSFDGTNIHLSPNLSQDYFDNELVDKFVVSSDEIYDFSVMLKYQYDEETKKSKKIDVIVPPDYILPKKFIEWLTRDITEDSDIPRFIASDSFYSEIQRNDDNLDKVEEKIIETNIKIENLGVSNEHKQGEIEQEKEKYNKRNKAVQIKYRAIESNLEKKEKELSIKDMLLKESANDDILIEGLTRDKKELEVAKAELERELIEYKKKLKDEEKEHTDKIAALNTEIQIQKKEAEKAKQNVEQYIIQINELKEEKDQFISENKSILNPTIQSVFEKYNDDDVLSRKIHIICTSLDKAISASDCMAFNEVENSIDMMRETYRKVLQVVFANILKKKAANLPQYFSAMYGHGVELQSYCKNLNIPGCYQGMKDFHALANAFGHIQESGDKKEDNERIITDFKNKSTNKSREKILLSIPQFFNALNLPKKELKAISNVLSNTKN